MNPKDTIPDGFVFPPDTVDATKREPTTREGKTPVRRPSALVDDDALATGYDPYNTSAHPRFTRPATRS